MNETTKYALDQVNRLCGGGAEVVEVGGRDSIIAPQYKGAVRLLNGEVLGGQDAVAIANLYCRHPQDLADEMVRAEWTVTP